MLPGPDALPLRKDFRKQILRALPSFLSTFLVAATAAAARAAIGFSGGVVIDRAYTEYLSNADLSTVIPYDDTIPQVTEGVQILAASITPKSTTSRLRLRVQGFGSVANSSDVIVAAFFVNGGANAIAAGVGSAAVGVGALTSVDVEFEYVPGTTSAQAITVRVGGAVGTIRMNGSTAARRFGGIARTTLLVEEITP